MKIARLITAVVVLLTIATLSPPAEAAAANVGRVTVDRYRGGVASQGGVRVIIGMEAMRNSKGQTTTLRSRASIRRLSKVSVVTIERVRFQRAGTTLRDVKKPVSTTGSDTVQAVSGWTSVPAGSCASYRTVADLTVRWSSGSQSRIVETSPYTRVCGPPKPKPPVIKPPTSKPPARPGNPGNSKNCSDFRTYAEANAWFRKYFPYYGDVAKLDADNDGIPCETLL